MRQRSSQTLDPLRHTGGKECFCDMCNTSMALCVSTCVYLCTTWLVVWCLQVCCGCRWCRRCSTSCCWWSASVWCVWSFSTPATSSTDSNSTPSPPSSPCCPVRWMPDKTHRTFQTIFHYFPSPRTLEVGDENDDLKNSLWSHFTTPTGVLLLRNAQRRTRDGEGLMQICEGSSRVRGYPMEAFAVWDARDFTPNSW